MQHDKVEFRTVTIPACENHEGIKSIDVTLKWICPICKSPRGKIEKVFSYDGSLRMQCDGWQNPCGHIDKYSDVRKEATRKIEGE